ncbi:EAL domain-containing protein [Wenzhouxiangella sp. XN24]|uniref:bifunctional diguanylate cyclase/phosphodiesterase n=1 Tax=Wenzhouxiangella sp. XN24 TaxID=2713569 RepID=UPI0013EB8A5E|nr:EAL domain-containing protein [Wenzhouxiangella sp. XN24]NGX15162.1 EAL domain-containing protein [Wenzhouxiangella sp. XN24]
MGITDTLTAVPSGREDAPGVLPPALAEQLMFFRLAERIGEAVLLHDDRIRYANPAAEALLAGGESLLGRRLADMIQPGHAGSLDAWLKARHAGRQSAVRLELRDAHELVVECELSGFPVPMDNALVGTVVRPTREALLKSARQQGTQLAEATLESISEGVITTDTRGRIDYLNSAAEALLGCQRDHAQGRQIGDLATLVDESDRRPFGDPVARCLEERRRVDLGRRALLISRASGDEYSVELRASPIRTGGGETSGCVIVLHDVSELRGLTRQMSYQASHDPLTGLVNRREFERRLEEALKTGRSGGGHVLCYLDLDRFKAVNDTSGHMAGDNMLREIAGILKEQIRDSDIVARVGGDEFGLLLVGCPLDKARQIADDVCGAIRDYRFVWRDKIFSVGASIGLVQIGPESGSIEDTLSAADSACYVAKQQGRGRIHVYSSRDEAVARQRGEIIWLQRLQTALKENRFELHIQPIVAVDGRPDGGPACEVLLRLRDGDGVECQPVDFMQAAERYHLMPSVDRWVLQATFAAVGAGALKLPAGRSVAVNVSSQTLADPQFLEFVVECLDRSGVRAEQVCFELSESTVAANMSHTSRFVAVLHGLGCTFALDDFGSGLGSFANLKQLSMDYLKIDGSFIRGLGSDDVSIAMVTAMIELARTLGIKVVAEHVETEQAFDLVRALKVDFVQGYAVGRPVALAAKLG